MIAIVVLGQQSVSVARQIAIALPNATVYGLSDRTTGVDVSFTNFGDTLRELFASGTAIVGICAAGILIRTLAPLLSDKRQEPPVLAVAEDGSAVVPLLGGLHGVNDMARQIGAVLGIAPAITTTGDLRFHTALLSPPDGYHLANPESAKKFIADLLAGASFTLEGNAPWLSNSQLPIASITSSNSELTIQVTEYEVTEKPNTLVYHPKTLVIGIDGAISTEPQAAIALVTETLTQANLSPHAIAAVFALEIHAGHPGIQAIATAFNVPVRFFKIATGTAESIAMTAVGAAGQLIISDQQKQCAIAVAPLPLQVDEIGQRRGQLAIVGTGPGSSEWMSPEVKAILKSATDWVGYSTYLNLVEPLRQGQQRHDSDNRVEIDRAKQALDLAASGREVAIVSSGDPGIYAMASAVFEILEQENKPEWHRIEIKVCPGISAMQAAAALVGAPLGHDFCAISLSDILKPWDAIATRIAAAAEADFAIAFYNPVSKQRTWQLEKAREILLKWRSPQTPIVLAKNLGRAGQSIEIETLDQLSADRADMRTIILVGSSKTRTIPKPYGGDWIYTPRRYGDR
jgi:cobalt-precorrin 5A hydrolase / precorrin-3B C17-methyltransferase